MPDEKPIDPMGEFDSDEHAAQEKLRFPGRPADKTSWWIEGDRLCIPNSDGLTILNCTRAYIEELVRGHSQMLYKIQDLEFEANLRNPSRFLPEVISKLEKAACAAIDKDDNGRAEAYAMAVMLIRQNLKPEERRR